MRPAAGIPWPPPLQTTFARQGSSQTGLVTRESWLAWSAPYSRVDARHTLWVQRSLRPRRKALPKLGSILDPQYDSGDTVHRRRIPMGQLRWRFPDLSSKDPERLGAQEISIKGLILRDIAIKRVSQRPCLHSSNPHDRDASILS